MQLFDKKTLI